MVANVTGVQHKVVAAAGEVAAEEFDNRQSPEARSQAQEVSALEQLERMVVGVDSCQKPGHGEVVLRTIPGLSASEQHLSPSDDFGDVELMKFGVGVGEPPSEQGFLVQCSGAQFSVTQAGGARVVDGCVEIDKLHELLDVVEKRLALRERVNQTVHDLRDFYI